MSSAESVLSVSDFNRIVSQTLSESFPYVVVEGEVSAAKVWQQKYLYFDLKDAESVMPCFAVTAQISPELLQEGDTVRVTGSPRLVQKSGKYSFTVRSVEPVGEGALRKAFERMKQKLEAEGLFAPERKRPLPLIPTTIGIITSRDGAVIHDIQRTLASRWGKLNLVLAPVAVQGRDAAMTVANAIRYFNAHRPVDVLIIARGGGSYEDLAAFNDESLARAIAASRIPTISAIGHESDVSIADLVADLRAPTPTAAAQLVVPERSEFELRLAHLSQAMHRSITASIHESRGELAANTHRFRRFFELQRFTLERLRTTMISAIRTTRHTLAIKEQSLTQSRRSLVVGTHQIMVTKRQQLGLVAGAVRTMDPSRILRQGYAMVRSTGGAVIDSVANVVAGDQLKVQLKDGQLLTWVMERKDMNDKINLI